MTSAPKRPLFLGLDCSTQSISAVVIDACLSIVYECALRFDEELPEFATTNGVRRDLHDPNVVVVPSLMLVDALDRIFEELSKQRERFKLEDVVCVSGSAQQHTSAYWRRGFDLKEMMGSANITDPLVDALRKANGFALECGPSWMDSSTSRFCDELEREIGGADRVARISGSRAYPRFTGNQIAKFLQEDAAFLDRVGRISLASSLLTSLLIGEMSPIDTSDASGMNLLNLRTKNWSPDLINATAKHAHDGTNAAERLVAMLGSTVVPAYNLVGTVHRYFQRKFGFRAECYVVPFSGDNPCTLAGVGLAQTGDVAVSLGTSSTLMAVVEPVDTACAKEEGHFFLNPVDPHTLMAMVCFKNGALAREDVRDQHASSSWSEFESLLSQTQPGNNGVVGFFMRDPEITPLTTKAGTVVFSSTDVVLDHKSQLDRASAVRAVVESQCMSLRLHADRLCIQTVRRLVATGGGSVSGGYLQVLADVFDVPVLRLRCGANSAALGAAFRAHHGSLCAESASGFVPFTVIDSLQFELVACPLAANVAVYKSLLPRFEQLETRMISMLN